MASVKDGRVKVMILKVDRDIDVKEMDRICEVIERYRAEGYAFSILDLGMVNHVNFVCLRRLAQVASRQRRSGGALTLSGMSGYLRNVFQIVGVYNDFHYVNNCTTGLHEIRRARGARDLDVAVIHGPGLRGVI